MSDTPTKKTGLNQVQVVSPELSAVIGSGNKTRPEVVTQLWNYIREKGLQDTTNKKLINADEKLEAVLGKKQVDMFELQKLISAHLTKVA